MKKAVTSFTLAAALLLLPMSAAWGQISIGVHGSYLSEIDAGMNLGSVDGTIGIGARAGIGVPLMGLNLLGTFDVFFPDCGSDDCEYQAATVNLLYGPPVSVLLKPYFGVGGVVINTEGGSALLRDMSDWGVNLLCGIKFGGGGLTPFVEGKYQVMKDFEDQMVLSAGVNLSTW